MWWSTTVHQLFQELVPLGNMNRVVFSKILRSAFDCCVLVVPLKIRDGLALMIDVTLAALNAGFRLPRCVVAGALALSDILPVSDGSRPLSSRPEA